MRLRERVEVRVDRAQIGGEEEQWDKISRRDRQGSDRWEEREKGQETMGQDLLGTIILCYAFNLGACGRIMILFATLISYSAVEINLKLFFRGDHEPSMQPNLK